MQNIVKMTTLLTHYDYIETYRGVRDAFFQEPYPPNTLLIVESLALPDFMVEIEAVAVLDWKAEKMFAGVSVLSVVIRYRARELRLFFAAIFSQMAFAAIWTASAVYRMSALPARSPIK